MTRILNVLLDLSLLPAGSRIAELGFEQLMTGHRLEADVDVTLFAAADLVDRGAHVVVDATAGDASEHAECMIVGIEQHLVRLQEIGPHDERAAVAQLRMRHLQFCALIGPIFRPIELEGFAGVERQGHTCPAARRLQFSLPVITPFPSKCRHPVVGALVAEAHQVSMVVRFCLRPFSDSVFSQADNRSVNGSSLLGLSGTLNFGSTPPARRYLRMVFRDRLVLRQISRIDRCSRKCQRRITLSNAMSITPGPPLKTCEGRLKHGAILNGNIGLHRVSSQWKSTLIRQ